MLEEIAILSPDAIIIVDTVEKKVVFSNPAAVALVDLKTDDPISRIEALLASVITEDQVYILSKYSAVRNTAVTRNLEFRFLGNNGDLIWLNGSTYLFNNKRLVFVILRDVTAARHHENYLVEFGTKKNTLLDTLVHQLNGALLLMNNLALRAEKLDIAKDQAALSTFISLVYQNSNHCIKIINDLLTEEHSESPAVHVKFSRVDVVKTVNYIFEELKKSQPTRNFAFNTTSPEIYINTDDLKFLQVINNIASNAVKFTKESGEVRFSISEDETTVLISVTDSGIGIPNALQPFLFEKHGLARRTGLNGEKSIGLGLFICKNLTNLLGGRIWIESEEGRGTRAFIELPKEEV
jgi:two-component system sensor histidine kinase VicK